MYSLPLFLFAMQLPVPMTAASTPMKCIVWLMIVRITLVTSLSLPHERTTNKLIISNGSTCVAASEQRAIVKESPSSSTALTMDRRDLLMNKSKLLLSTSILGFFLSSEPLTNVAHAAYGDSSNIALPSYVDFLIEKNKQADPSTFLYQGADRDIQLQRIASAISQIETIPNIAQSKKWSQVQGVITGPLGTLIATMNQIGGKNKEAKQLVAKVKVDLFSIGQCATTKNESACIAATEATLRDVNEFVKVAF